MLVSEPLIDLISTHGAYTDKNNLLIEWIIFSLEFYIN